MEDVDKYGRPHRFIFHHSRGIRRNWKGGRHIISRGYWGVLAKGHPRANRKGYVREHVLIMEQHLGRPLNDGEIVHHINGNKLDNRIENLAVMMHDEHTALHRITAPPWTFYQKGHPYYPKRRLTC